MEFIYPGGAISQKRIFLADRLHWFGIILFDFFDSRYSESRKRITISLEKRKKVFAKESDEIHSFEKTFEVSFNNREIFITKFYK